MITTSAIVDDTNITVNTYVNMEFDVPDDSMEQLLPKGSMVKVKFQSEYKSGDILGMFYKDSNERFIRKLYIEKDGTRKLMPFNPAYDVQEFDAAIMSILGRVDSVVTKL